MTDYTPDSYFPQSYFGGSYFGATDTATGAMYAALSGTSGLTAVLSVAGGAVVGNLAAALAGNGALTGDATIDGYVPPIFHYTRPRRRVAYALPIPVPKQVKGRMRGRGLVYAEPTAVAGISGGLAGASKATATISATIPAAASIAAASRLTASLTGVFDYITDDNNFWLLAA